jgi:lipopolysaccharide/colanic/teichoic acid biosynthesis glycosyltransferase
MARGNDANRFQPSPARALRANQVHAEPAPLPDRRKSSRRSTILGRSSPEATLDFESPSTAGLFVLRLLAWARRVRLMFALSIQGSGRHVRRGIDILGAGFGLLLALPVLVLAALAVKLTSRGPIFYLQERIGRNGRSFQLLKFRSMVQNADAMKTALSLACPEALDGVRFKLRRDPRLTIIGPFLRKFSIDELPQILNVLKGDMTLVGPRPPVRREVVEYTPKALRRLEVEPGLTCLWQIRGRSELSFVQQVELDVEYIDTVKPLDELAIVLKTVPAVLSGRGAY